MKHGVTGERTDGKSHEELKQVIVDDFVHHRNDSDGNEADGTDDNTGQYWEPPHCHTTHTSINTENPQTGTQHTETLFVTDCR